MDSLANFFYEVVVPCTIPSFWPDSWDGFKLIWELLAILLSGIFFLANGKLIWTILGARNCYIYELSRPLALMAS